MAKVITITQGPDGDRTGYVFFCGDRTTIPVHAPHSGSPNARGPTLPKNQIRVKDLFACLKQGFLSKRQVAAAIQNFEISDPKFHVNRLKMYAAAEKIYSSLPGSLVDLNITSAFREPSWWDTFPESYEVSRHRSTAFSCIAHFDTGRLDIPPSQLGGAMAVSSQNSIYVADILLLDQSKAFTTCGVRRITGNIGKPGLAILIPPSNPKIRETSCNTWRVDNEPFDGKLQDSFSGTSLHLSLTGYELPVDSGRHGFRDNECMFIETAVSLFDRGEWVADLDLLDAADLWQKSCSEGPCRGHTQDEQLDTSKIRSFLCVDSWLSLLDPPLSHSIVRAYQNPGARLAATCLALQKGYDFHILGSEPCWTCTDNMAREPRQKKTRNIIIMEDMNEDTVNDNQPEDSDGDAEDANVSEPTESLGGEPLEPLFQDTVIQSANSPCPVPSGDESLESDFGGFVTGIVFIC